MTGNEFAVLTMLNPNLTPAQRTQRLAAVRQQLRVKLGEVCPECGSHDIGWNGEHGSAASYRCNGCDHGWDAED